jgi:hypothetical protein
LGRHFSTLNGNLMFWQRGQTDWSRHLSFLGHKLRYCHMENRKSTAGLEGGINALKG